MNVTIASFDNLSNSLLTKHPLMNGDDNWKSGPMGQEKNYGKH